MKKSKQKGFKRGEIKFVIIIDEWDAIFRIRKEDKEGQTLYLEFLRDWLKDKSYVALAYMTGILPIKKYGQHSALNMFDEYSILAPMQLAGYTGFTDEEVRDLCDHYGRDYGKIKDWYDGYDVNLWAIWCIVHRFCGVRWGKKNVPVNEVFLHRSHKLDKKINMIMIMMKKKYAALAMAILFTLTGCAREDTGRDAGTEVVVQTEVVEVFENAEESREKQGESKKEDSAEKTGSMEKAGSEEKAFLEEIREMETEFETEGILSVPEDIGLVNPDGDGKNYVFSYGEETFQAIYTPDNWKVVDSYRIAVRKDIRIICQALLKEHPIHGADGRSFRTAEDMAYEWIQHNLAYKLLPEDEPWRENARDVDLNPSDQGKTFSQMYEERTGKKWDPAMFDFTNQGSTGREQ